MRGYPQTSRLRLIHPCRIGRPGTRALSRTDQPAAHLPSTRLPRPDPEHVTRRRTALLLVASAFLLVGCNDDSSSAGGDAPATAVADRPADAPLSPSPAPPPESELPSPP